MSTSSPAFEYADDGTRLAVNLTDDGAIRVWAASGGVGAAVELSIVGAQRLASMLGSAVTTVIRRGLPGGSTN